MEDKRGIKLKTKQTSLVDNIVSFFKKENSPAHDNLNQFQNNQSQDASPRSTTPRKRIFDKTPEKAGKINSNKKSIDCNNRNFVHKSIGAGFQVSMNQQNQSFDGPQLRSNLPPPLKLNYDSKPMEDTHFNKLILDTSAMNSQNKKMIIPQKTYLSDHPDNLRQRKNTYSPHKTKSITSVSDRMGELQTVKKMQKQLQNHKRLLEELRMENTNLKKQNESMSQQLQNLKKQVKSYELSNRTHLNVETVNLDTPKSPFEKGSFKNQLQPKSMPSKGALQYKQVQQKKIGNFMKQSIPILPDTPSEYGRTNQMPQMEQMSFMSSNLKSISHQNSFLSDHSDSNQLPNFNKKLNYPNTKEKIQQDLKSNHQILSPFMEKTVYDKTTRPSQKINKKHNQIREKEQITFSQTVGYLKGDQPEFHNKKQYNNSPHSIIKNSSYQQISKNNSQGTNKNPFQQIATESNKFLFQQKNQLPSGNSFKVHQTSKEFPTRQWLNFNQSEGSLQYSNKDKSQCFQYNQFGQPESSNLFERPQKLGGKRKNEFSQKQEKFNKTNLSKQNSGIKKQRFEESKTYRFEDFDAQDEGSSYVDFF